LKKRTEYMPAGHLGTRRMGDLAELAFMYRAASQGIGVARPYGDSYPYDVLVQHGRRLSRIQVKSCFSLEKRRYTGFPIIVASHWRGQQVGYSIEEIDFIAAFIARHDAWYLIPIEALGKVKNIRLYPTARKLKRPGGRYECYREAWHLLKDENLAAKGMEASVPNTDPCRVISGSPEFGRTWSGRSE
jgi:hypothetical protein